MSGFISFIAGKNKIPPLMEDSSYDLLSSKNLRNITEDDYFFLLLDAQEMAHAWLRRHIRKKSLGYTLEQIHGVIINHIYNDRIVFTFIDPYDKKKTLTIPRSFLDEFQEETKVLVEGILHRDPASFMDFKTWRIIRSWIPYISSRDIVAVNVLS